MMKVKTDLLLDIRNHLYDHKLQIADHYEMEEGEYGTGQHYHNLQHTQRHDLGIIQTLKEIEGILKENNVPLDNRKPKDFPPTMAFTEGW